MTTSLSPEQIAHFKREGWRAPCRAGNADDATVRADWVNEYERHRGVNINQHLMRIKGHLALSWIVALGRNELIPDVVEGLIRQDILLFGASIFAESGHEGSYVSST